LVNALHYKEKSKIKMKFVDYKNPETALPIAILGDLKILGRTH
jgi:hypothetical protein